MYKVFIVEDEELLRNGMRENINWNEAGYEFTGDASDGEEALPKIRNIRPDIIVTDIKMPFMNGLELSRIVKREFPNIKIIVLTGYDEFDFAREALSIGASEYILKPFSASKLVSALKNITDKINDEKKEKIRDYERYIVERDLVKKLENKEEIVSEDFYRNDNENIEEFLKLGNSETIETFVNKYITRLERASKRSYLYTYYTFINIFMLASKYISELNGEITEVIPEIRDMEKICLTLDSIEELRSHIIHIFEKVILFRDGKKTDKYVTTIEEAKKFIGKKYYDPELSLNLVAYHVGMSSNHFSAVFRNETGESFIDYLTNMRVRKAKEMLNSSPMKTYEIAEKVGYNDAHYFSQIFRKITGTTPTEYRKK